jgi:surface antigen
MRRLLLTVQWQHLLVWCLILSLYTIILPAQIVKAQTLDPTYEAVTPYTTVSYCNGGPGDGRTYCRRNCTSFVAYKLEASGVAFDEYRNLGDAYKWLSNAASRGITNGETPKVGAVAWWGTSQGGGLGHVGWVEAVNADGTVKTSNYDGYTESYYVNNSAKPEKYIYFSNVTDPPQSELSGNFIGSDRLGVNQTLKSGQYILSPNAQHVLIMQGDGNLVLYGPGMRARWSSGTSGSGANRAVMQSDGNLVLYRPNNTAAWSSGTAGRGQSTAIMQSDGNFVIYKNGGGATWYTRTGGYSSLTYVGSDRLKSGQTLNGGQFIRSSDKRFVALMQSDGNLVVYGPAYQVLWNTRTSGNGGARLIMQGDGNLVVYVGSKALWNSETAGTGSSNAIVQNDANFVTYAASGSATWSYKTGRIY